ncbi:MAG: integrase [Isosphaera sp.]|nr:integrase [Isosphaera sp.]
MADAHDSSTDLVVIHNALAAGRTVGDVPAAVAAAGPAARFAWDEFFAGELANPHTRAAYARAARRFLGWCEAAGLALRDITPGHVGDYFAHHAGSVPTKKLHLAAVRRFFDRLVVRHAVVLNPALSVRAERYQVVEGKTPEIAVLQARALLAAIDTEHVVGLRDRAVVAVLIYTAVRVGAVARLALRDLRHDGTQWSLRFAEKGGKSREIPVRHDLEGILFDYLAAAGAQAGGSGPFFRSAAGRTGRLTDRPLAAADMGRLVKRRLRDAQLPGHLSPHSFRVATITDLLGQGVSLEEVQYLAGHADPRTTRLYDRRQKRVTRNVVERISV